MSIERRTFAVEELRADTSSGAPKIIGYAALFNSQSRTLRQGGRVFREQIAPGAFRDALTSSDTRALFNHDPNFVLGRTKAGTLTVSEDAKGLRIENTPPDTQWARDLMVSISRGDITQMSFGFMLAKGGDSWTRSTEGDVRTIHSVRELLDVSPVTYPAYEDTSAALRSFEAAFPDEEAPAGLSVSLAAQKLAHRRRW